MATARELNRLAHLRQEDSAARGLESNTKKATAFVRKVRTLTEESRQPLLDEMGKLNLRLYVSEVAASIAEAKLRGSDMGAATAIASAMHQLYADYSKELLPLVHKAAVAPAPAGEAEADRSARLGRKRVALRLLGELFVAGVSVDFAPVLGALKEMARQDAEASKPTDGPAPALLGNLTGIVSFAKNCGPALLAPHLAALGLAEGEGAAPAGAEGADRLEEICTEREAKQLQLLLSNYLKLASRLALSEHARMHRQERANRRALQSTGELSEEHASQYECVKRSFDRLWAGAAALAELLRTPLAPLPAEADDEEAARQAAAGADGSGQAGADGGSRVVLGFGDMDVWQDEEEASFYTQFADLRASLPAMLLGAAADAPAGAEPAGAGGAAGTAGGAGASGHHPMDNLLLTLPACCSRAKVDRLAEELCYAGLRGAPGRLARALAAPPPGRPELLPYYARLGATLQLAGFTELSGALCAQVLAAFDAAAAPSAPGAPRASSAPALRLAAYIGELCKFGILPADALLTRLRASLGELEARGRADAFCALLDCCGRYLYRAAPTHARTAALLELALRLKSVRQVSDDSDAAIEAVVAQCMPPLAAARAPAEPALPPVRAYVRHLLSAELIDQRVDRILGKLRKLPWRAEQTLGPFVLAELLRACESRLEALPLTASLISGLGKSADELTVQWVDALLEHFHAALRRADHREAQLLTCRARLLGELFNYRVLSSSQVLSVLHALVPFARPLLGDWYASGEHVPPRAADAARAAAGAAHAGAAEGSDGAGASALAARLPPLFEEGCVAAGLPPRESADDCTRVWLVCALLETCGSYFATGRAKRRLDRFLGYFQVLVAAKRATMDVEFAVADVFDQLRPQAPRHRSLRAAVADVRRRELRDRPGGGAAGGAGGAGEAEGARAASDDGADRADGEDGGEPERDSQGRSIAGAGAARAHSDDGDEGSGRVRGSAADGAPPAGAWTAEAGSSGGPSGAAARARRAAQQPQQVAPTAAEEDEFERMMSAMVSESIDAQRQARAGAGVGAVSLPTVSSFGGLAGGGPARPSAAASAEPGGPGMVGLRLLSKRGHNKTRAAELHVPLASGLAQAHLQHEAHEQLERLQLKKLVLQRDFDDDSGRPPLDGAALYSGAAPINANSSLLPTMGPRANRGRGGGQGAADF